MAVTWWMVAWLFVVLILELVNLGLVIRLRRMSIDMQCMQNLINDAQVKVNTQVRERLLRLESDAHKVDF